MLGSPKEIDQDIRVLSTGTEDLDAKIGGGIPYQTLMLIEGESASGKSTLSHQFLWGALESGEKAALYTTEQTVQCFNRHMSSLGMDVRDYFLLDHLQIYPVSIPPGSIDPSYLFQELGEHINNQSDCQVIVFDSLTTFVSGVGEDQIQSFLIQCKTLCDSGKVVICTIHSQAFEAGVMTRFRSICDTYLQLRIQKTGSHLQKTIEVAKVKGAETTTGNISGFDVEPGLGIRIVPILKARA